MTNRRLERTRKGEWNSINRKGEKMRERDGQGERGVSEMKSNIDTENERNQKRKKKKIRGERRG